MSHDINTIKNIYIPYLRAGYSDKTVQNLLSDMKVYHVEDHEKIQQKALEILTQQNDEIKNRNLKRHVFVRILDTLLWALSFGLLRLLERDVKIGPFMITAGKVHDYVVKTPIVNQMRRPDYDEACEILRKEEEERKEEMDRLEREQEAKEKERVDAQKKLEELRKHQEETKRAAAALAKQQTEIKQKEWEAKSIIEQQEFDAQQAALNAEIHQREEEANAIKKQIKDKAKTTEQHEIKKLKSAWQDLTANELSRLQAKNVYPSVADASIQATIPHAHMQNQNSRKDDAKVMVGRVLELKQYYKNTHYVFTHGQGIGISVVNECMYRLLETFTPDLHNPLSMPFRLPYTIDLTENIEQFFKKYPNIDGNAFNDDELNKTTGELLSVDSYMWNTAGSESALSFGVTGTNINTGADKEIGIKIFRNIFINYLKDNILCEIIAKKAALIAAEKSTTSKVGVLWAVCIPKTIVQDPAKNFVYRSHAYGRRCRCHTAANDIDVLERTQRDEVVQCYSSNGHPQYRILTSRLVQEPGVRAFPVNALKKKDNKQYSHRIKNLVRELAFYSKMVTLTQVPSLEESTKLKEELLALYNFRQIDREALEYLMLTKQDVLTDDLKDTMGILNATYDDNFAHG